MIDLVDQAGRTADMGAFVAHLHRNGRLTASLLLRALAQGQMAFFEWGISELAGVPHHRTWLMIHDAGPLGLKAIYERAGLPARLFPAFRSGVDTFHRSKSTAAARDKERFQERMLQRFLTQPQAGARRRTWTICSRRWTVWRRGQAAKRRRPQRQLGGPDNGFRRSDDHVRQRWRSPPERVKPESRRGCCGSGDLVFQSQPGLGRSGGRRS